MQVAFFGALAPGTGAAGAIRGPACPHFDFVSEFGDVTWGQARRASPRSAWAAIPSRDRQRVPVPDVLRPRFRAGTGSSECQSALLYEVLAELIWGLALAACHRRSSDFNDVGGRRGPNPGQAASASPHVRRSRTGAAVAIRGPVCSHFDLVSEFSKA